MEIVHSQDAPLEPDQSKTVSNKDSDQTFALNSDDPTRVENRGGLEKAISDNSDDDDTDQSTRSEYSSG